MPVDSPNVGIAFALVCGAGAATALGASVVFFPRLVQLASRRVLASALGLSAGVMLYASLVDIFQKSADAFGDAGYNDDGDAFAYTTLCFFGGVVGMVVMDVVVKCITCRGHHDDYEPHDHHHQDPIEKSHCAHEQVKTNPDVLTPHCFACADDPVGELEAWQHMAKHQAAHEEGASESTDDYGDIRQTQTVSLSSIHDDDTNDPLGEVDASQHMDNHQVANEGHQLGAAKSSEHDIENGCGISQAHAVEGSNASSHNDDTDDRAGEVKDWQHVTSRQVAHCGHQEGAAESTDIENDGGIRQTQAVVRVGSDVSSHTTESTSTTPLDEEKDQKNLVHMGLHTAFAIGLHNFPEGLATFVVALDDPQVGAVLAIAIAIHNIPEGLCVALPFYYATGNRWKAFLWACVSGISEPIAALLGWAVLANVVSGIVYAILFGLVAGMMVTVSVKELLPTAHRYDPEDTVVTYSFIGGMAVMALSLVLFVV